MWPPMPRGHDNQAGGASRIRTAGMGGSASGHFAVNVLVVGLVGETRAEAAVRPLLYHHGRFGRFLPFHG
jgi:hypothetical protein